MEPAASLERELDADLVEATGDPAPVTPRRFYRTLYFRVLVAVVLGVVVGRVWPGTGERLKPLADGFLKLVRMLIAPIIFLSVVSGIAGVGDLRRLGRIGLKALVYFELVSTLALGIGLVVATVVGPGKGINATAATLDAKAVAQYTTESQHQGPVDFLLNIIPDSFVGAFSKGEILQVLLLAILTGVALATLKNNDGLAARAVHATHAIGRVFFRIVAIVMEAAPLGAFGGHGLYHR